MSFDDTAFASVFAVPYEGGTDSAEALAAATAVVQHVSLHGADPATITNPPASAPSPPGDPVPLTVTVLPPSGRISTRSRRRTAAAAGTAPPAVDSVFGPGGGPRPSARRANTPRRVHGRDRLAVVTAPTPATSTAATVRIPSGCDCAEPVGAPLLRLPPSPGVPSATAADLDALGAAAELQFGDSAARYSYADWAREQQSEPACHAAMRYIVLVRPPALPADFLPGFHLHQRPSFSEIQELAGKGRLHTTDDGIVLLVRTGGLV